MAKFEEIVGVRNHGVFLHLPYMSFETSLWLNFGKKKTICFISNFAMKINGQKFPDCLILRSVTILKGKYQMYVIFIREVHIGKTLPSEAIENKSTIFPFI